MSTGPGAVGLRWLWATVADLGPGSEPDTLLFIEWTRPSFMITDDSSRFPRGDRP
jgi:hypothetical protein